MRYAMFKFVTAFLFVAFFVPTKPAEAAEEWHDWFFDTGIYLTKDVEHHFFLARENFNKGDMKGASTQILTAADLMKYEANRAPADEKQALLNSIQELEQLAEGVTKGKVKSDKELGDAFARAHYILATHHALQASEALKKNEAPNAANALKSSELHLQNSMTWSGKQAAPAPAKSAQASPKSQVPTIKDEDEAMLETEPAHHFSLARDDFLKKDMNASAGEIRTASAFLKLEADHATGEGKKALTDSLTELQKLTDEMEKAPGTITAPQLDVAFARADLALARHHYQMATEDWNKKETQKTGYALQAASNHLENAAELLGHKGEEPVRNVVSETGPVAGELIKGSKVTPDEVSKILKDGPSAVEKLGAAEKAEK